jgi:hypothetical protein
MAASFQKRHRSELLSLEELNCTLVLFRSRTAAERTKIPAATSLWILFSGIQPIFS